MVKENITELIFKHEYPESAIFAANLVPIRC